MNQLPLADLDAFAAVARAQNFRAAAKLRGVSASALSEAMRRLEARLGVRLFNRTTRSVTLTEAGRRLIERLSPVLSEVETALDDINSFRDTPVGRLKLDVPGIVARCILPPIAVRFLSAYPGITLEVSANDSFVDVLAEGCDAGVRYEESLQQDMIAVPIGPREQRFVVAASPGYVAEHGAPAHPRDLMQHRCILHRFASGRVLHWTFERGEERITIHPPARLVAEANEMEVAAAVAGLGIVCTFEDFLQPALSTGDLVVIMPDWIQTFSGPFLYYPSRTYMPAPLRAFVDFLRADQTRR
ncbi:LysR family transcriptional regulator [Rhizobium sp. TRM95111]|uniref:LysR family transcriptional regulator n=1 Tax=Rhizobium alarense TaxID=2846851 RepID=UPI001F231C1F|nr:LysR family transcriptional regulator [Rhizobium alarense]MCF3643129.1 LysR family transcriptional regulator [Rhizobium alarense]